jgi:hypothetical protein
MLKSMLRAAVVSSMLTTFAFSQELPRPIVRGGPEPFDPVAQDPEGDLERRLVQEAATAWNQANAVIVARLDAFTEGPATMSMPPIHMNKLELTIESVLRGDMPEKKLAIQHRYRGDPNFAYEVGKTYVLAIEDMMGGASVTRIEVADEETIKSVKLACALPMGWSAQGGKAISPWGTLGKDYWQATLPESFKPETVCSITGRPALPAKGAHLGAESVPPAKEVKWSNPDGDGEYTVTVTNPTLEAIEVPALLTQDGKILWDDSLLIICQGKSYPLPKAKPVKGKVGFVTLKPGESVSTVVNVLSLKGPDWPRGGYRIAFTFALDNKSETKSLYYMSKHHDKLRSAAQK